MGTRNSDRPVKIRWQIEKLANDKQDTNAHSNLRRRTRPVREPIATPGPGPGPGHRSAQAVE